MGVQRAVNIVLTLITKGHQNIRTLGPLIHNPQAIRALESKGVKVIENIEDDSSDGEIVVIRAHGIPPETRKELQKKNLIIKDATCPKVLKVQSIIKRHMNLGYQAVIIGDKGHPEVKGLQGFAGAGGYVVNSLQEARNLPRFEKICVVAQTTQTEDKFLEISEVLKEKTKECLIYNTICESTNRRQAEITELAVTADLMVIIGGRNSGNTQRLVEMARFAGTRTIHIESEEELDAAALAGCNTVGVSAGASTPAWVIERVIHRIRQLGGAGNEKFD